MVILKVKANEHGEPIHNFWNNIHFHPTDAIEDDWGRRILDQVSEDHAAQYVRMYAMLEDIVSRGKNGILEYDFSKTDERIDYLIQKGFRLLICFNFLPKAIAAKPECMSVLARYKGKRINTSEPADYEEWEEICYRYTEHLLKRYGEDTLSKWYFHCWNEPDLPGYFLSDTDRKTEMEKVIKTYCKLYGHFAKGVRRACKTVKIGGPSAALSNKLIKGFLEYVKEGSEIDFLSIHTYGTFPVNLEQGETVGIDNTLKRVKELKKLSEECGFHNLPIIVDEWGLSTEGFTSAEESPALSFRNTELYASAFAHLIHIYTREKAPVLRQMICLSGQHNLEKDFHGYRSFFTVSGFQKPIYNAYVMAAKLGEFLVEGENFDEKTEIGIFPTKAKDGRLAIMIYRFQPDKTKEVTDRHIKLKIEGLKGRYEIGHYRIDHEHCNAYTAWCERGKKPHSNQKEREEILQAGKWKLWYPREIVQVEESFDMDLILPENAVSLIELIPRQEK